MDFHEILYVSILWLSIQNIQVPLNSDTNNGYFTWTSLNTYDKKAAQKNARVSLDQNLFQDRPAKHAAGVLLNETL